MKDNYENLKQLLKQLFQFDQADLDFGIYRIMNAKRDEVTRFIDYDLLPQVREALGKLEQEDRSALESELAEAIKQAKAVGVDPETAPRVRELRQKLAGKSDVEALESEVFSDLYTFFRRYYSEGDFLSLRRYKEGVYAIPYEGEEVKLYWANNDQYYIKTAEYFRDYVFTLSDGRRVHFKLVEADTEQNNSQSTNGKDRRFILYDQKCIASENDELIIRFEYRNDPEKRKQADLNSQAVDRIFQAEAARQWLTELAAKAPTPKNPDRTVLEKRLNDYTARNTFDYFIHKDLGGFLRRELDFFIKNEVMHLDDIESESAPRVEQYLAKIKAIRHVAHKIIDFLAQLENFQKKLWLKKKFVIETNYCITLDRIPEDLYPEIANNDSQRNEWVALFAIDEIKNHLTSPDYAQPLSVEFLKANKSLVVDTRYFPHSFTRRLLASITDLDGEVSGILINNENFQALRFLSARYRSSLAAVYIDPPYNTDSSSIIYKNDYKHSSWLSLIENRLITALPLMMHDGIICLAIDDEEVVQARRVFGDIFPKQIGVAVVRSNPQSRKTKGKFSPVHEYALFYGASQESIPGSLEPTEKRIARYPKEDEKGRFAWMNFIRTGSNDQRSDRPKLYYPIFVSDDNKIRIPEMTWCPDRGKFGEYVLNEDAKPNEVAVYPIAETESATMEKNWHRGHVRVSLEPEEYRVRRDTKGKVFIDFKTRMDEGSTPSTWWDSNEYASANYGAAELKALFGQKVFDFPKAVSLVTDCLRAANVASESLVLDYFAGSGTTGHALMKLNREDGGRRKYILVDMGDSFGAVLIPRMKKVTYSEDWKDGKPVSRVGVSHIFKYIRLESYEDTLNNLELKPSGEQRALLERHQMLREDYVLRYMLDVESQGSTSLLNIDQFENPFSYKLKVSTGSAGETQLVDIDLVETFNWFLGLHVSHIDVIRDFHVVQGRNPAGEKVLIIWRNTREKSNAALDEFFLKQGYNTRDMEFDLIYVNGDNNLENLKRPDETWKVRLIEQEFKRLMFDVQDL